PGNVFGLSWNADLVHQVITSMLSDSRVIYAHTKGRGQVSGGGKKPWRQKGTGRARHGSTRSPIWVGGGVAHGPRNDKSYKQKINKKVMVKALYTLLSKKYSLGQIMFVDSISMTAPKTKEAKATVLALSKVDGFEKIATKKHNAALIALSAKNSPTEKSFANFGSVALEEVRNLNPLDIINNKYLIITDPEKSVAFLAGKVATKK
ncbi:MAG: 50S ribosomal protein L4, partial [Candidatus Paceibacterota bacterium]